MKQLIEETVTFIKDFYQNEYSGHDYDHSLRVYKTAVRLAEKENADLFIVSMAALLHDVDDRKLSPETADTKANAVNYLRRKNIDVNTIETICRIIDEVSFAGTDSVIPGTVEGKCVQDADRLDALGAIGIARAFAYGGNHHRKMYDPEEPPMRNMNREEYRNHVSHTVNHFYEKLFLLKDMMNTETGKKIAEQREAFMRDFLAEFYREWDGNDR